jgi:hypothetical protein
MQLVIDPQGRVRLVYTEVLDLSSLGPLVIQRASWVEPDASGHWQADLSLSGGPTLGPFALRSDALRAEEQWLSEHWLLTRPPGRR